MAAADQVGQSAQDTYVDMEYTENWPEELENLEVDLHRRLAEATKVGLIVEVAAGKDQDFDPMAGTEIGHVLNSSVKQKKIY